MIVVDAHEDIAYNALCYGRDYRRAAWETRRLEANNEVTKQRGQATVGLPDSLLGRVGLVFATLFVAPYDGTDDKPWSKLTYHTPREAYDLATRQLDYYNRLADEDERVRLVKTAADLDAVLATWNDGAGVADHRQGLVLLMENADPILEPTQFEEWYERGVRIVGPAWEATRYCGGTGYPGPLTPLGFELLDVMAGLNAILDLSHMAEIAFLQAVDHYEGVIIASHSNPRHFRNSDRHLSDAMIKRLAERDGVMGIVLFNAFLSDTYKKGDRKTDVPLAVVIEAVDYVCQLTGSAAHVGIGSDFDGGFGAEHIPDGLDTTSDLWLIGERLRARGYAEADIAAILGGNMLRKLRQGLPGG
ncbi:MAG: membrane dipeptidase [Chloroflexi bacterium]|nr:membrane dipeptidase [Chloroflexota bacterium]